MPESAENTRRLVTLLYWLVVAMARAVIRSLPPHQTSEVEMRLDDLLKEAGRPYPRETT